MSNDNLSSNPSKDALSKDQEAWVEYAAEEAQRCEHGCLPTERCEDCLYVPDLPCGADL